MFMETVLYNAIIKWFEDSIEDWGNIDNPEWITYVCKETGITEKEYRTIMQLSEVENMKEITFRYRDELSNWEWRTQHCIVPSVKKCIEIYGLGVDCDYEILEVKEIKK